MKIIFSGSFLGRSISDHKWTFVLLQLPNINIILGKMFKKVEGNKKLDPLPKCWLISYWPPFLGLFYIFKRIEETAETPDLYPPKKWWKWSENFSYVLYQLYPGQVVPTFHLSTLYLTFFDTHLTLYPCILVIQFPDILLGNFCLVENN